MVDFFNYSITLPVLHFYLFKLNCRSVVPLDRLESGVDIYLLFDRDAHISSIAFHPTRHMAVSSSYGGDFKVIWKNCYVCLGFVSGDNYLLYFYIFQIWVCKEEIQQKGQMLQNSGWMCHAVGSYKYIILL